MKYGNRVGGFLTSVGHIIEARPLYCVAFFLIFMCVFYGFKLDHRGVGGGDELGYLRSAYHLVHNGVVSSSPIREEFEPTGRRAPGYPAFLAAGIRLIPDLYKNDFECVFNYEPGVSKEPHALVYLKYIQAGLLLFTALMVGWLILDITGRRVPAYLSLWFVGMHSFLGRYVNRLYAEVFGAFLMTLFTLFLYLGLKRKSVLHLLVSGVVLGYMTLTFPQWKLVGCVTIPSVLLCVVLVREKVLKMLVGVVLMAAIWVAIFHPWELRNERIFGRQFLSLGGGAVLEVRAQYDLMPWSAYFSSFAYWSRSPVLKKGLLKFVDKKHYVTLLRQEPGSAYQEMIKKRHDLSQVFNPVETNTRLMQGALETMKAHPVRHLLTAIPIAFRGMMNPTFSLFYIGVYFLFMLAVYKALVGKQWIVATLLATPLGLFGFNAMVTHGLPRYSEQAAPLLILGVVIGYCLKKKSVPNQIL
ncbi:hypothetical protein [Pseudodesulfovibrio sediminis]|uniref:Glycosyltransferase RgtA/B/C/D-like domain-containing protein n=1 Tax=Pseudodesulfovibrio sediminis TaxID=2810563 RepID=A0ABN6ER32_9BACT|nr:hypothetical protein [Pseudodesulfovibrio sediminis]BCS87536.1 hypothetical protein PSDVSF_07780 [Pseudodesulfovibrio sediminis]